MIHRNGDYGLLVLMHMAEQPVGTLFPIGSLAQQEGVPEGFLYKIVQKLSRAGIVASRRGPRGGVALACSPEEITVRGVLEALQGPLAMNRCFGGGEGCPNRSTCLLGRRLSRVQEAMVSLFDSVTIAQLMRKQARKDRETSSESSSFVSTGDKTTESLLDSRVEAQSSGRWEMDFEPIWGAMEDVFGDDERRKEHARQVTRYAEQLLRSEPGNEKVVITTAILHDIGIPASIRKYGNANGPNQEKEGPPIARRILEDLDCPKEVVDEVCTIIASHHSPGEVDTDNFRIVYDADWLVNLKDEYDMRDKEKLSKIIDRIFLTATGRRIARERFLPS